MDTHLTQTTPSTPNPYEKQSAMPRQTATPSKSFLPRLAAAFGLLLQAGVVEAQTAPEAAPAPTTPAAQTVPAAEPAAAPAESAPTAIPAPPEAAQQSAAVVTPAAAAPTPAATAAPADPRESAPSYARLDYSDGSFYLRSTNDNVVFVPSGRVHIDTYAFGGPGVSDYHRSNGTGLKADIFFRRFIIEFGGIIRRRWFYWVGGNFAPTTVDGVQAPVSVANVYDGFAGLIINQHHRLYFGQYNAPVTMENVTSSRWMDFMERALVVRTVATPYNKTDGLMAWGETSNNSFEYQIGVFGGDGMNRMNIDNVFDGMGRMLVRPLANRSDSLKRFHLGVSGRIGGRNPEFVRYNAPNLTTPGGYAFWQSQYTDSGTKIDIIPSGAQGVIGGEFYVPFERWDFRGEAYYAHEGRREAADSDRATTLRKGLFWGYGAYAQLSWWPLGTPRINGNPAGKYGVLRVPDGPGLQAPYGLQVLLRAELMRMNYSGNERSGADRTPGSLSATTNNINVNAYQAAINYWATKHVRLTAEYTLYQFPGGPSNNQALAPGRVVNVASNAHLLNEVSFRVGLAL